MTPPPGPLAPREARILICDDLSPAALEVFRERGLEPVVCTGLSEDELVERVAEAHALIVRSATKITRRVLEAAPQLRVVGRAGVGVDNVDCATATARGVVVMNTPTGNTTTTGELAIALLLALARHIPRADRLVRAGSWSKKGLVGTEVTGKRLGVIGLGRIGRVVAERALGLRMEVVAHDPYLAASGKASPVEGALLVDLDELVETSDFITLHVPLSDSTRNLLSRERLARTRPGVRIVNAARGGLVDEAALLELLDAGHVAGAALDVLAEEPPAQGHPLVGRDDVILTPHLGASSAEAQHNVAVDVARQIADFLLDGVAHNAVNAPALPAATLKRIAPYVTLGEKIGAFLAQRTVAPVRKLEVTLSGPTVGEAREYLLLSILVGALRASVGGVNYVNAPLVAAEHGVRVLESEEPEHHAYQDLIKVRATTLGGERSHLVSGTVFGRHPRFVRVDDLHLDLAPSGAILVTDHTDRPGVIGEIGTLLGRSGVNIQRLELGTAKGGARAQGFLSLDQAPDEATLEAIRALEAIEGAQLVQL
jgi:D-3-phosphoglycerate dehydrogenase